MTTALQELPMPTHLGRRIYHRLILQAVQVLTVPNHRGLTHFLNSETPQTILVNCNSRNIGNMVAATPLFEALKRQARGSRITVVAAKATASLLENNPYVDEVVEHDSPYPLVKRGYGYGVRHHLRLWREIRRRRPGIEVDLEPYHEEMLAAACARVRYRIGLLAPVWGFERCFTGYVHQTDQTPFQVSLAQIAGLLGIRWSVECRPKIFLSDREIEWARSFLREQASPSVSRLVGLHPGAAWPTKRWPEQSWVALIREMDRRYGAMCVLLGGPDEADLAQRIAGACDTPIFAAVGRLTLRQTAAILRRLPLLVSSNSGLMHIALSQSTPVVALNGPSPVKWIVESPICRNVRRSTCVPCDSAVCLKGTNECMNAIGVDDVLQAVDVTLRETAGFRHEDHDRHP